MLLRQLAALLIPLTVAGIVPWALLSRPGELSRWPPPAALVVAAAALAGVGLYVTAITIRWFATQGQGTLAPWDPPRKLVISGIYRHVRNPMIMGVFCMLLAELLAFQSTALAAWTAFAVALNLFYIPLSEEPALERRFGERYREYKRNVPRWIPRRTPWLG